MVFRMSRRVTDPGRFLFSSLLIIASLLKTVFHKFGRVSCYSFARCFASPLYLGEEGQGTGSSRGGTSLHFLFLHLVGSIFWGTPSQGHDGQRRILIRIAHKRSTVGQKKVLAITC